MRLRAHPYRGVQSLYMPVQRSRMPARPLWLSAIGCPLERQWENREEPTDAEAFAAWLDSGMTREQ